MSHVATIEIGELLAFGELDPGVALWDADDPRVQAEDLIRQLVEASNAGASVILLHVSSRGGDVRAGFALYTALRRLQRAGRKVVAFVDLGAYSAASLVVLAADLIVIHPGAAIWPHGVVQGEGVPACPEAPLYNSAVGILLATRTALDVETCKECSAPSSLADLGGIAFWGAQATLLGVADACGDLEHARKLASRLAGGEQFRSLRQAALQAGAEAQEAAAVEDALDQLGGLFINVALLA